MRLLVPLVATVVLSAAACGGSSPPKAANASDGTDEATGAPTKAGESAASEDAVIVTECDGLDEFTCNITGGCEWSASKTSCGKEAGR